MNDRSLFKYTLIILCLPIAIASGCNERFRYQCQDPDNWEKEVCKMPRCDVTRTCPEHIFKGQRDPRLGPPPTRVEPLAATQAPICQQPAGACK
jgi:hypothetical protein